ncbi:MAG: hypothetical protein JO110_21310, partial [Acetobacteraceae bacterium]|nr:hypothetical protein [Acetobacteraceae bacterium]
IGALLALLLVSSALARQADPPPGTPDVRGVVELEASSPGDISVRLAEDIASVVDDGLTRRVLPVIGKGGLQTLADLVGLRGIDLAIVQTDVLEYAAQQRLLPDLDRVTYVTKLPEQDFHLLARPEIKNVNDLANLPVNVDIRGSATSITAGRLFQVLKVTPVINNDRQDSAMEKLRKGEIAAVALVGAKPARLFQSLKPEDGLHFVAIPYDPATNPYIPASLTAEDYPSLLGKGEPVETVAVSTVLLVANLQPRSDRYRNAANVVDTLFTQFQLLSEPGHLPQWREVNVAAELPGWRRFPPAEQWLRRNAPVAAQTSPQDLKAAFSAFIDKRQQVIGGPAMSQEQKDELFQNFLRWSGGHAQ